MYMFNWSNLHFLLAKDKKLNNETDVDISFFILGLGMLLEMTGLQVYNAISVFFEKRTT